MKLENIGCGLVMNKDEIQLRQLCIVVLACCGLVMTKDEIQRPARYTMRAASCGLVMNKDEIQPYNNDYN